MKLYHVTTEKKIKKYHETGCILKPVRGFTTLTAALVWAVRVGRSVVLEIEADRGVCHKLPDHHNRHGEAWWVDANVMEWKGCVK